MSCCRILGIQFLEYCYLAQELAPRTYWASLEGANVLVVGYQYSEGDIVTDPSLPITGVESKINFAQVSYQRTLSLFGRTTNLQFNLPYTRGSTEGFVDGEFLSRNISTMADARLRLSINLRAAPTMVLPFKKRHAIRASLSTGIITESGGDFENFSLNYAYVWR